MTSKIVRQNIEPIDTFILTMDDIKEGEALMGSSCPVAYMIGNQYERIQYENINICRLDIEYECQGHTFNKENAWTLFALIHSIDHPNVPAIAFNTINKSRKHLFGGEKGLLPPYTIEEYENYFNLVLPGIEKAHLDEFATDTKFDNQEEMKALQINYTPYTGAL